MKLISARARRAPAPTSTVNRAPAILVPRSKSITPSAGPRSQCACGVNANSRGVPMRRTSPLSAALFPTGTDACGRLGMSSRSAIAPLLDRLALHLELLDLLRALPVRLLDPRRCPAPGAWRAPPRRQPCSAPASGPPAPGAAAGAAIRGLARSSSSDGRGQGHGSCRAARTASRLSRRKAGSSMMGPFRSYITHT